MTPKHAILYHHLHPHIRGTKYGILIEFAQFLYVHLNHFEGSMFGPYIPKGMSDHKCWFKFDDKPDD